MINWSLQKCVNPATACSVGFSLCLALSPLYAFSQTVSAVLASKETIQQSLIDPDKHPHQSRKVDGSEVYVFDGSFNVRGQAIFYWDVEFEERPGRVATLNNLTTKKRLAMRFYPDSQSQQVLPNFNDSENARTSRVFIYAGMVGATGHQVDLANPKIVTPELRAQIYKVAGAQFLKEQSGFVNRSVDFKIDGVYSVFEANHRFVFARPQAIKLGVADISSTTGVQADLSDGAYLSLPWVRFFQIKKTVPLKSAPSFSAKVRRVLVENDTVELVSIKPNGWALVRKQTKSMAHDEGYLKTDVLWLIN